MELNVSQFDDYREIIRVLSKELKIRFKNLAASARIHTSYFSRVMNGDADFSSSQLYLIARDLSLGGWQLDYFLLLGEWARSGESSHRSYLKGQIQGIQKEKQKTIAEMEEVETEFTEEYTREYYQEAVTAEIHMYLTIEKYRKNPNLILSKVLIPEFKLQLELQKLEKLGVLKREENGEVELLKFHVHLDEASSLITSTHINWRLETINYLSKRTPRPSDHHISAAFTTDQNGKQKIRDLFKKFVLNAQKEAAANRENEEVFHICFDLY